MYDFDDLFTEYVESDDFDAFDDEYYREVMSWEDHNWKEDQDANDLL